MVIQDVLIDAGWSLAHTVVLPQRNKQVFDTDGLALSESAKRFLQASASSLYLHQKEAVREFTDRQNVCMTTGTASGKSLPFYIAGINQLAQNPGSKVIAINRR